MAIETREHQIGDHQVTITTLPAGKGIAIARRLVGKLGPALGRGLGAAGSGPGAGLASLLDADWSQVGQAVTDLCARLDDASTDVLIRDLCAGVTVDGQDAHKGFDSVFAAEYDLLVKVVAQVLEDNYRLPLASWGAAVRGALAAAKAKATTPPTSAPPSATTPAGS